jgi:UDP-glucuronate decarboxylase
MKHILVAGGAGFLGSHLCETLLARGNTVTCLDNFRTGTRANIAHLSDHPRFELIEQSIMAAGTLSAPCDEIYNLACPASPAQYQIDPHYTLMVNVVGVDNLLHLARRKGARILQASTSEVYGDPLNETQIETDWGHVSCTGPRACYDEGKRCAETLLFDEHRKSGHPIKVARIFNTYGPRMREDDGRVISNFVVQALHGRPITVYGDGSQTRSFCYVDDLIDGLIRLMESPENVTGPINLGNPEEVATIALARRIKELLNSKSEIVFQPLPEDDPKRRRPSITAAREILGWQPTTPLSTGLPLTAAYFKSRMRRWRTALQPSAEPAVLFKEAAAGS